MFNSIRKTIEARLDALEPGQVVVVADFDDIAEPKTVSKILTRLMHCKPVEKVMRGMFCKKSDRVSEPSISEIANGIARSNGWHIVPTDDTALYVLGVTKNKPRVWTFVSDGTSRSYTVGENHFVFKHSAARYVTAYSQQTATLVQALKAVGPHITPEKMLEDLKPYLHKINFKQLSVECKKAPAWIASLLFSFCMLYEKMNGII